MAYYKERIGYRANAKHTADNRLFGGKPIKPNDGFVTVFAERRNNRSGLGEYGGDAYPLVDEYEINSSYSLGLVLVSDGVGNASYPHPSLGEYLDARVSEYGLKDDSQNSKLMIFLQDLYGPEIFSAEYKPVLDYALKCFAPVPADGYFAADAEHWYDADNFQRSKPFYERDSQSLGSRIICVGLYKTAVEWLRDNKEKFQSVPSEEKIAELADGLKKRLEAYAFGDGEDSFRQRTQQTRQGKTMFSYDDAPNTDKRDRYYLAATVAAWFYLYDSTGSVQAVSINIGDARTYLINKADGVRQISVDDAFPNNDMRGFVNRGKEPKKNNEYCDKSFFARIIKSSLPCALFACSDGIYETVCNVNDDGSGRRYLPYGDSNDAKDILFEKNLLEAVRRSYSFDDFKRELVFTFYAQPEKVGRVIESCESWGIGDAKRDDSGTAAVRFFGADPNAPVEIFKELRSTKDTSLDKLWQLLEKQYNEDGTQIPYSQPHITPKEDRMRDQKLQYAIGNFKTAVFESLVAKYSEAYDSMAAAQANTVWGLAQGDEKWSRPTWKLAIGNNLVEVLNNALKDWEEINSNSGAIPAEWATEKLYEHVIFDKEMLALLKEIGFDIAYKELTSDPPLTEEDLQPRLYEWFEKALFGAAPEGAKNDGYEYHNREYIWLPKEGLRTPDLWEESLKTVIAQFKEEMAKQYSAAEESGESLNEESVTAQSADVAHPAETATPVEPVGVNNTEEPTVSDISAGVVGTEETLAYKALESIDVPVETAAPEALSGGIGEATTPEALAGTEPDAGGNEETQAVPHTDSDDTNS